MNPKARPSNLTITDIFRWWNPAISGLAASDWRARAGWTVRRYTITVSPTLDISVMWVFWEKAKDPCAPNLFFSPYFHFVIRDLIYQYLVQLLLCVEGRKGILKYNQFISTFILFSLADYYTKRHFLFFKEWVIHFIKLIYGCILTIIVAHFSISGSAVILIS